MYSPNFSQFSKEKFRIFVDGSYNKFIEMGSIGYCFPEKYKGKKIKALQYNYSKFFKVKSSIDVEIMAIKKGIEVIEELIRDNPFLIKDIIRIKSDCIFVSKYIHKGKKMEKDIINYSEENILLIDDIRKKVDKIKSTGCNIKISYIPSKLNLAHNYCYAPLRKQFEKIFDENLPKT